MTPRQRKYTLRDGQTFTVYISAKLHAYIVSQARKRGVSRNRALAEIVAEHKAESVFSDRRSQ